MKIVKLVLSALMVIFAILAAVGFIQFEKAIPMLIMCAAFITFLDAKRLASEKRYNEARTLMNTVIFMVALVIIVLFGGFSGGGK